MCVTYLTNGKYISYLNSIKKSNINESTGNLQEKKKQGYETFVHYRDRIVTEV